MEDQEAMYGGMTEYEIREAISDAEHDSGYASIEPEVLTDLLDEIERLREKVKELS